MVFARMGIPEERTHLIEYGIVGALIFEALTERRQGAVVLPALLAMFLTSVFGAIDEFLQELIPNRVFDPRDIVFNTIAGILAVTSCAFLRGVRRFVTRSGDPSPPL